MPNFAPIPEKRRPLSHCAALLIAQTLVVLNDNAGKLMLFGLAAAVLSRQGSVNATSLLAVLLVVPFVIFAPVAGWISDRFAKTMVIRWTLAAQAMGIAVIAGGIGMESYFIALAGFGLLALQSCFFSPARQGVLKELVGKDRLAVAVGLMELLTVAAILLGGYAGGWVFDRLTVFFSGDPWSGGAVTAGLLGLSAMLSLLIFWPVPQTTAQMREPFRLDVFGRHFRDLLVVWRHGYLRYTALGVAFVWFIGGIMILILMNFGNVAHDGRAGAATESGLLMALLGVGIVIGSALAAHMSRAGVQPGYAAVGCVGMLVGLLLLTILPLGGGWFRLGLIFVGINAGLFMVPLNALLQERAPDNYRGRVLAATNLMVNIGGIAAVILQWTLNTVVGLTITAQIFALAVMVLPVMLLTLWLLRGETAWLILRLVALVIRSRRLAAVTPLPVSGGAFITVRSDFTDILSVAAVSARPVRFWHDRDSGGSPWWRWLGLHIGGSGEPGAMRRFLQHLRMGDMVGMLASGRENVQRLEKRTRRIRLPVHELKDDCIAAGNGTGGVHLPENCNQELKMANQSEFHYCREPDFARNHPEIERSLGLALIDALKRDTNEELIVDLTEERKAIKGNVLLAVACCLARKIRREVPEPRVGIVLPPGLGGFLANAAVVLAGKVPVNLNFTLGSDALKACLSTSGVRTTLSANAMRAKLKERFPSMPWSEVVHDLPTIIKGFSKFSIIGRLLCNRLRSAESIATGLGLPLEGGDREAALLFTSGSDGDPKGVILTHRNILMNSTQVYRSDVLPPGQSILANLPIFHSFGFTVTIWCTLLNGIRVVTVPTPLDVKKAAEAIRDEQVGIVLGTPTFFRPYLHKVKAEDLQSLRIAVAGAEKTPDGFCEAWQKRFPKCRYLEGYGLTETSPVVSVNLPDRDGEVWTREGSVGRVFPGIEVRTLDPDSGEELPLGSTGTLAFRGPSVFPGYLDDPERTAAAFDDGWFVTGDLGRIDEDGFLFIEGRLSRFSKIGGEMIPHGKVEQVIAEVYDQQESEQAVFCVAARADDQKGEALILLTTMDITLSDLRQRLGEKGLPNLWIPREIRRVGTIPVLASGKLDIKGCQKIAAEGVGGSS